MLAGASQFADPFAYVSEHMAAFDRGLNFDPEQSPDVIADRRAMELMEEVA